MSRFKKYYNYLRLLGFDPEKAVNTIRGLPPFMSDYFKLKKQIEYSNNDFPVKEFNFCLEDRLAESGTIELHYFHQDLLIARRIFLNHPIKHVDVGSRIDGFVAHVASYREIEVFDIRPLDKHIPNIKFIQVDFTKEIEEGLVNYCDSISCLHALEHFGLGRYGDTIDYYGYLKGLNNLNQIVTTGGKLYISVPMGEQRIEFNAHRVFSLSFLLSILKENYSIDQFSYINDNNELFENSELSEENIMKNFNCHYGCAIFELTKV